MNSCGAMRDGAPADLTVILRHSTFDYITRLSVIIAAMRGPVEFTIGDRLQLRKPHPCGGYQWRVTRLGADIGLQCESCGRYVMLPRRELEKRIKAKLPPADIPKEG